MATQRSANVVDNFLPILVERAEALQAKLTRGCTKEYAEAELNKLNAFWIQLQGMATQHGVWLGNYDGSVGRLEIALVQTKNYLQSMVERQDYWRAFLGRLVRVANAVLGFFHLPKINTRLLSAVEQLLLPPAW